MVSREYPSRPLVGAGAIVHRGGRVLLVKRKYPPNEGKWSLPGGLVELGETVHGAAAREVKEETGLTVAIEGLLDVGTDVHYGKGSSPKYNYVLVDYVARPVGGKLKLNNESSESGWFAREKAEALDMTPGTRAVVTRFFELESVGFKLPARRSSQKRSAQSSYCFSLFPLSHHSR